jgi:hypothetical protein
MLLQAVIRVGLEVHEDFNIGSLDLSITLWMSNGCIVDFDTQILAVSLECTAGELGPVVSDDPVWDPKPTNHRLDELNCELLVDLDHNGCFRPHGELVDCDTYIPESSDDPGEWT